MKIISKFHDYYDGCGYSNDSATGVYVRKEEEHFIEWFGRHAETTFRTGSCRSFELSTILIGFCGELYPCVRFIKEEVDKPVKTKILWTFEEVEQARQQYKRELQSRRLYYCGILECRWPRKLDIARAWFDKNFSDIIEVSSKDNYINPQDIFLQYKTPCFVIYPRQIRKTEARLVINPKLEDLKFYQQVDTFTAYQQIEMFINNQIVKPDDPYIEPISDKIKAENHGFDKHSFRKDKKK